MGYGEQIREGVWTPDAGAGHAVDPSVSSAAEFGTTAGSTVMPYIYPNLAFAQNSSWWHKAGSRNEASIGDESF